MRVKYPIFWQVFFAGLALMLVWWLFAAGIINHFVSWLGLILATLAIGAFSSFESLMEVATLTFFFGAPALYILFSLFFRTSEIWQGFKYFLFSAMPFWIFICTVCFSVISFICLADLCEINAADEPFFTILLVSSVLIAASGSVFAFRIKERYDFSFAGCLTFLSGTPFVWREFGYGGSLATIIAFLIYITILLRGYDVFALLRGRNETVSDKRGYWD